MPGSWGKNDFESRRRFSITSDVEQLLDTNQGADLEADRCPALREALEMLDRAAAELQRPVLVGIGGPGGSGKSTFAAVLAGQLGGARILSLDDYRKPRFERRRGIYGSHPEGNRLELLRGHLAAARCGEVFSRPVFCRVRGAAMETEELGPADFLIADGEITAHQDLRGEFDLRILILADWGQQWRARMGRDREERDCDFRKALSLFFRSNLCDYPRFAMGAARDAHLLLRRRGERRLLVVRRE